MDVCLNPNELCRHAGAQLTASESFLESLGWGSADAPPPQPLQADPQVCCSVTVAALCGPWSSCADVSDSRACGLDQAEAGVLDRLSIAWAGVVG